MGARPPIDLFRQLRDVKVVESSDLELDIGPYEFEHQINAVDGVTNRTLPPSVGNRHLLHIKRVDDTDNVVTIKPAGTDLIDDSSAVALVGQWSDLILLDAVPGVWSILGPVIPVLPPGGTTGQVLGKASGDDGDVTWTNGTGIVPASARPTTANEIIDAGVDLGFWP